VGDFVLLQPGDIIPTDGVLVAGSILSNQVTLTGERNGKQKITCPPDYEPSDKNDTNDRYLVFRGAEVGTTIFLDPPRTVFDVFLACSA
jgi:magnesium-transporting ATPase (P-type)